MIVDWLGQPPWISGNDVLNQLGDLLAFLGLQLHGGKAFELFDKVKEITILGLGCVSIKVALLGFESRLVMPHCLREEVVEAAVVELDRGVELVSVSVVDMSQEVGPFWHHGLAVAERPLLNLDLVLQKRLNGLSHIISLNSEGFHLQERRDLLGVLALENLSHFLDHSF